MATNKQEAQARYFTASNEAHKLWEQAEVVREDLIAARENVQSLEEKLELAEGTYRDKQVHAHVLGREYENTAD